MNMKDQGSWKPRSTGSWRGSREAARGWVGEATATLALPAGKQDPCGIQTNETERGMGMRVELQEQVQVELEVQVEIEQL